MLFRSPRLTAGVPVRIGVRNLTSLSGAETSQARVAMERALRRKVIKQTPVCDVTVTLAENLRETLLVAEFVCGNDRDAAMVPFRVETPAKLARRTLERRLLWEQEEPLLDVALTDGKMIVLDTAKVAVYVSEAGKWNLRGSFALDGPQPRDPRGRIQAATVFLPNQTCRGAMAGDLQLVCERTNGDFAVNGVQAHFAEGRNTIEADGWPAFYSLAHTDRYYLLSEADGRTRIYDQERRPIGRADGWGSELVSVCGGKVLATQSADRDSADSITLYGIPGGKPVNESEPADFPGQIGRAHV